MTMPGPTELIVIFLIVFLIFGAKRLPKLGESMGKGIRYFKNALSGVDGDNRKIEERKKSDS